MIGSSDSLFTHIVYRLDHPKERLELVRKKLFWTMAAALGFIFLISLSSHYVQASARLNTYWINSVTHSLFESYCSIISLTIAYAIYNDYQASGKRSSLFLLFAFTSMGIFDLFHAFANHSVTLFVWYHCLSAFCGGLFLLLSSRAVRYAKSDPSWKRRLWVLSGISLTIAIAVLMSEFSRLLPNAITAESIAHDPVDLPYILYFTSATATASVCATIWFFLAGVYFTRYFSRTNDLLFYIIALASFLFFESELLFAYSNIWGLTWWYWHAIKLIVYVGLSVGFAHGFARTFRELYESRQTLSLTVDKLTRAYDDLKDTQQDLLESEKLASIGKMAAAISHEIRNPLGAIKNAVGIFEHHSRLSSSDEELLHIIGKEINRLNAFITDFLDFAKPHPLNLSLNNLNALIEETIVLIDPDGAAGPPVIIGRSLAENLPEIMIDSDAMKQVLWNILMNAFQAMPEGGTLTVTTIWRPRISDDSTRGEATISISDTGRGMSPETIKKAFQPFFSTKTKGTGLGLSIVERIIKQHGGRISVESTPYCGTTVFISMPVHAEQPMTAETGYHVVHPDR